MDGRNFGGSIPHEVPDLAPRLNEREVESNEAADRLLVNETD